MAASPAVGTLDRLAQDVFDVMKQLSLVAARGRRRPGDLKDGEFHTLSLLHERGIMIVGDIQRELGVLPAQMSRIIRSLENRDRPYITCGINPHDKRKVNVALTNEGVKVLHEHRQVRISRISQVLRKLNEDDLERLETVLERVRDLVRRKNGE
jgi:DNA-binding MarR family transcriptional regulator